VPFAAISPCGTRDATLRGSNRGSRVFGRGTVALIRPRVDNILGKYPIRQDHADTTSVGSSCEGRRDRPRPGPRDIWASSQDLGPVAAEPASAGRRRQALRDRTGSSGLVHGPPRYGANPASSDAGGAKYHASAMSSVFGRRATKSHQRRRKVVSSDATENHRALYRSEPARSAAGNHRPRTVAEDRAPRRNRWVSSDARK
jgi:hypothetical protein